MDQFPAHWGLDFTPTIHNKPEGPTDPNNVKLPSNFVAVVTGAGKGVGYHIALSFAKAGARGIVIGSRTQADLDKLAAEIKKTHPNVEVVVQSCDICKPEQVKALADATWAKFGRLDAIVANAGVISRFVKRDDGKEYIPMGIVEDEDFGRVIDTNIMGSYHAAKYFVPQLQATKDGVQAFVGITSAASHMTDTNVQPIAYIMSKLAINRMVESIHADYFKADGIQAFAVHPGTINTGMTENYHTTQLGDFWTQLLVDDVALCGGFITWLTAEKRDWLSGRYVSVNWDTDELLKKKDEIVEKDLLTAKMAV